MFIALEGGEGAGKTTLAAALAAHFAARGARVLATREPGGTPEGQALRALLLPEDGFGWEPAAELLLMTAARVQHVARVIRPALAAGTMVLCDRFVASTLAYQGGGHGLPEATILALHEALVGQWPDRTLLLDLDPALGLARARARQAAATTNEGRFEAQDLAFHARVRAVFLRLAATNPGWTVLDASQPLPRLLQAAQAALDP